MLEFDEQSQIHRGHVEARRALAQWLDFIRIKKRQVIKDWASCEATDPARLPLAEQLKRGDFGSNVVPLSNASKPSLDSMSQIPVESYTHSVDNDDIKPVITKINKVVRAYFYVPATVMSYVDFCSLLEQIKQEIEQQAMTCGACSVYERDLELADCHYAFIHAGLGKLTGDVETGISHESPESLEVAVAMLAGLCEKSCHSYAKKLQNTHTAAQNLQASLSDKTSLPKPTHF